MTKHTEIDRASQEPNAELLIRHRWIGDPWARTYRCCPGIPSLYLSPDPICYGCDASLSWNDIPGLEKYRGICEDRYLGEALGVRLDLRFCELQMKRTTA